MEDFFKIISNFGFPVAVASYLLFRFEKILESLIEWVKLLIQEVKELRKEVKSLNKKVAKNK